MNNVFEEVVEDDNIKKLLPSIMRVVYDKPYQFLFINLDNQKFYKGFDRIKFKCE